MKNRKAKIRLPKCPVTVKVSDDDSDCLEFIAGMGYFLYEDPTDNRLVVISDKTMTFRDYFFSRLCVGCSTKEWFKENYSESMDLELYHFNTNTY